MFKFDMQTLNWRPFTPVVAILSFVFIWIVVFSAVAKTGVLWSLSSATYRDARVNVLQQQLFAKPPGNQVDVLVIGDREFIKNLQVQRPDLAKNAYVLQIPNFNYSDVAALRTAFSKISVARVLVQSSPHMWTDYWYKLPSQKTDLWDAQISSFKLSMDNVGLVFDTLSDWAKAKKAKTQVDERPVSLFATNPTTNPRRVRDISKTVRRLLAKNGTLVWVVDRSSVPDDTPQKVLEFFDAKMNPTSENKVKTGKVIANLATVSVNEWRGNQ